MSQPEITHELAAQEFDSQLEYILSNYKSHGLDSSNFNSVVIGGLGGSGIGGQLVKSIFMDKASLPIEVISGYNLPTYVNNKTLVLLSSYSGNTEETISMFQEAHIRGATCIAISTGGEIKNIATKHKDLFYPVLTGYQPRMALGFSFSYLVLILGEFFKLDKTQELQDCKEFIKNNGESFKEKAASLLGAFETTLGNKIVFITGEKYAPVALRACQQIQENAKREAFYHVLPECNHNVTESYYSKLPTNFIFIEGEIHERTKHRFTFLKQLLEKHNNLVQRIRPKNKGLMGVFEMVLTLDWVSILLSNRLENDNMRVRNIEDLKNFLKETK